jgi:hypothetical protein
MITIINKLISLLPNPRREVFQTRRMVFRGIDPVPMWIVPYWFAVLLERIDSRRQLRSIVPRISTRPDASSIPAQTADARPSSAPASTCSPGSSAAGTAARANRRHHIAG